MVMVLEESMVQEIARLGQSAYPNEACGLLLPSPVRGQQVIQLPNRSKEPADSVEIDDEDLILQLEAVYGERIPADAVNEITIWHTHPGGNIGPSKYDLQNKPKVFKFLVVTLFQDDRPPVPTWF